jgi:hypothetical protein
MGKLKDLKLDLKIIVFVECAPYDISTDQNIEIPRIPTVTLGRWDHCEPRIRAVPTHRVPSSFPSSAIGRPENPVMA